MRSIRPWHLLRHSSPHRRLPAVWYDTQWQADGQGNTQRRLAHNVGKIDTSGVFASFDISNGGLTTRNLDQGRFNWALLSFNEGTTTHATIPSTFNKPTKHSPLSRHDGCVAALLLLQMHAKRHFALTTSPGQAASLSASFPWTRRRI